LGYKRRWARPLLLVLTLIWTVLSIAPVSYYFSKTLEYDYGRVTLTQPPAGIVILGGALEYMPMDYPAWVELNQAGERVLVGAMLALQYPKTPVLICGGSGRVWGPAEVTEADRMKVLFENMGIPAKQILIDNRSRNTHENAVFCKQLADGLPPSTGGDWLLVTSAWHMKRSFSVFKKAGWTHLQPYPVDPIGHLEWLHGDPGRQISELGALIKEWIGYFSYQIMGRI
jgi:uncharacterized SAM-binding protein YcdF (DUF218 family)